MQIEYKALMELCALCSVAVPANMRVDQQLASRLIQQCTATVRGMVDTSDATVTATDIVKDKIGYGAAGKLVGTLVALDTSDATATAADIAEGKTAYVNGVKITGTAV